MDEVGWAFASVQPYPGAEKDPLYGYDHVKDLYLKADPDYTGRSVTAMGRYTRSNLQV
jgi:putative glutathione S-transferase